MAFSLPTEVLPKAAAFGMVLYGLGSFFITGPEVAARVAEFDHFPVCKSQYALLVRQAADAEKQALAPASDGSEAGLDYYKGMMGSEVFVALGQLGGWGGAMNNMIAEAEEKQRAGREAYKRGLAEIEANTRRKLANSDGFCGCVADAAIDKSRNDWALFAGSLGLFSSSKVENFGAAMTNPENINACAGTAKGTA